jgi:hypothetical protein
VCVRFHRIQELQQEFKIWRDRDSKKLQRKDEGQIHLAEIKIERAGTKLVGVELLRA